MKVIALMLFSLLALTSAVEKGSSQGSDDKGPQKGGSLTGLSGVWKFNLEGLTADPKTWSDTVKERLLYVAAGLAYAGYIGASNTMAIGYAVFLFGLVNLGWPIVASSGLALSGWRTKNKIFLGIGALSTYLLAYGSSLI